MNTENEWENVQKRIVDIPEYILRQESEVYIEEERKWFDKESETLLKRKFKLD